MATVTPYYGAVFSFKAVGSVFETNDGYTYGGNLGVNNISVDARINLPSQTDAEALAAVQELQALTGTGIFLLDDTSNFYYDIALCLDSFNVEYKLNDITDVTVNMSANHRAKALNVTSGYINDSFVSEWTGNQQYRRFDVVKYFEGLTGLSGGYVSGNASEMYFYCIGDVSGSGAPITNTGKWTRFDLPIELEIETNVETVSRAEEAALRGSFSQKVNKSSVNPLRPQILTVSWNNLNDKQAKCLVHFFENKQGYKRFNITGKKPQWNEYNVFVCAEWSHTFNYTDSHSISANFTPDVRFKTGYFTGFPYQYTDLNALMTAQWVPESGS